MTRWPPGSRTINSWAPYAEVWIGTTTSAPCMASTMRTISGTSTNRNVGPLRRRGSERVVRGCPHPRMGLIHHCRCAAGQDRKTDLVALGHLESDRTPVKIGTLWVDSREACESTALRTDRTEWKSLVD
jgi:hypothetical protein